MTCGGQCASCGLKVTWENTPAFLFHHRNPREKEFNLSGAHKRALNNVFDELRKCSAMCFNCHQILHAALTAEDIACAQQIPAPWCSVKSGKLIK